MDFSAMQFLIMDTDYCLFFFENYTNDVGKPYLSPSSQRVFDIINNFTHNWTQVLMENIFNSVKL